MSITKLNQGTKIFTLADLGDKPIGARATLIVADDFEPMPKVHNKHHGSAPADAIYIGRGSPWGNPFVIGIHGNREAVIELYRTRVMPHLDLTPLKGKHLVCFCKPAACHGDLLLEAANK